jgi:hypothetical protein
VRAVLVASVLLALAVPAGADHCAVYDADPELTTPATGVGLNHFLYGGGEDDPGIYYLDNDPCQPECAFSVWVYEETNGIPGLQRDREYGDGAGCIDADTILL